MKAKIILGAILFFLYALINASYAQTLTANAGNSQTICVGAAASLGGSPTASGGTAPYTYSWSPATGLSNPSISNPLASPMTTTTYTVTVTDDVANTASSSITVTVNPTPIVAISGLTSICLGSCVTLTSSGGTSYSWSTGQMNASITVCPVTNTTYTVTATNGGCSATNSTTVTVVGQIIPNVTSTNETCLQNDGTVTASVSGGMAPYSYTWNNGTTTQTNVSLPPGTYYLTVTDANGCTGSGAGVVQAYSFTPQVSASPDTVCSGASSIITATGGFVYEWCCGLGTNDTITVNPVTTTMYTVTVTDNCTSSLVETITVSVNSNAAAEAGNDVFICPSQAIMLQASGGVSYSWSPATDISNTSISNPIVNPSVTTMYYVTATSSCGSAVDSVLISVTASGSLVANAGIDYNINPGSCVWLGSSPGASGGTPPYNFSWSNGMTGNYINICPPSSASYTLTVTDAGGCEATDEGSIYMIGSTNWKISGTVFLDENGDGVQNPGEEPFEGIVVQKNPYYNYSYVSPGTADGIFNFYLTSTGSYTISIPSTSPYYTVTPASYLVNISSGGQNDTLNNFAFRPIPNVKELQVDNYNWSNPRPGFNYYVNLVYKNNGTIPMNGSVGFKHDPLCSYVTSNPLPSGIMGDTIIWNFTNLLVGESRSIMVTQSVPVGTPLGSQINMYSKILPVAGDTFPVNNYDSLHLIVVGSYDPNDKSVSPDRPLLSGEITNPVPLTYTIRFQNTGTYYAEKVFVRDTLSSDLDISSFEMLAASHKYSLSYIDPGILEWTFDSIMLPDSTTDLENSNGFISYRIKPLATLIESDTIKNTAYIYFDFNEPVMTNTSESYLEAVVVSVQGITNSGSLRIFPNPSHNEFAVEITDAANYPCKVKIYNSLANVVVTKEITQPVTSINTSEIKSGVYFIIVEDSNGSVVGKTKIIKL